MRLPTKSFAVLVIFSASMASAAENLDGSVPLLCAATEAIGCTMEQDCVKGSAKTVNLPTLIRIDAEKKRVQSHRQGGNERVSEIVSIHQNENTVVFFGIDGNQGWNLALNKTTGQMTATASSEGSGYIVFGVCTPI